MDGPARPVIECEGLGVGYGGTPVVEDATFSVADGSATAIVGPSGSGKTTLLRTLAGIVPPVGGRVVVLGSTLPEAPPHGQLGYVPQDLGLIMHQSAMTNVLHGTLAELGLVNSLLGRFPDAAKVAATDALDRVGLEGMERARVRTLSGGQRRRVAIARALVQEPRLLLADEMLSELDGKTAGAIIDLVHELQDRTGMTVVFVEHNLEVAERLADQLLRVEAGTIEVAAGLTTEHPEPRP